MHVFYSPLGGSAWPKSGGSGDWVKVGPWGIGDDILAKGESGTLADAVSPASKCVFVRSKSGLSFLPPTKLRNQAINNVCVVERYSVLHWKRNFLYE